MPDYWGRDLPVNVGLNNFDRVRYDYFRDRQVAFEAFKTGVLNYHEEFTSRFWATLYDFPAIKDGRVKREELPTAPATAQGWWFNQRRDKFKDPRIREAIGLGFDFEWTNKNIMFVAYRRTTSFFENSDMKAEGQPSPEELALLEPFRDKLPDSVFGEPTCRRSATARARTETSCGGRTSFLRDAGCKREGTC